MRTRLQPSHAFWKILTVKSMVGLVILEQTILVILAKSGKIKPTPTMSLVDIAIGFLPFITCIEMFLFSVIFLFTFNASRYRHAGRKGAYQAIEAGDGRGSSSKLVISRKFGFFRALLHVLNIWDIVVGCWRIPLLMIRTVQSENFPEKQVGMENFKRMVSTDGANSDYDLNTRKIGIPQSYGSSAFQHPPMYADPTQVQPHAPYPLTGNKPGSNPNPSTGQSITEATDGVEAVNNLTGNVIPPAMHHALLDTGVQQPVINTSYDPFDGAGDLANAVAGPDESGIDESTPMSAGS